MFDIAWSELLLIAVVALIFIGPKELPAVLHNLGRMAAKLRRSADEFRRHFEESMRESGYGDLHKNIQDLRSLNPSSQLRATLDSALNQTYTPPSPAPAVPALPPELPVAPQPEVSAGAGAVSEGHTPPERDHAPVQAAQVAEPAKDHATPVA